MEFFTKPQDRPGPPDLRSLAISRLRTLEQAAADGRKLSGNADLLKAAWHLRRAWEHAKCKGMKKETFQDRVFARLEHPHRSRKGFKLANYLLPRRYETVTKELIAAYDKKPGSLLRGLEPYLKGIEVAAVWCEADSDKWKIDFLQETSLWERSVATSGVQAPDDRPSETLALLLSNLCASIARRHDLLKVYEALRGLACRWEMFDDRLVPYSGNCMQWIDSPIRPIFGTASYFEESLPYPSIPLLRVPYLFAPTRVQVVPELASQALDISHANSEEYLRGSTGIKAVEGQPARDFYTFPDDIPDDIPGRRHLIADMIYQREIRLCIVPDGQEGFTAGLESRPRVELTIPEDDALSGRHAVHAAWKPDFGEPLFYARRPDGGPVLPTIRDSQGKIWRIGFYETNPDAWQVVTRNPKTTGWEFDADPIGAPGELEAEPWYLSYTPATPDFVSHWLTQDWSLADVRADCPWDRGSHDVDDNRYNRDLPPLHELKFPFECAARCVECCLYNGLIEEALGAAADRLVGQVSELQRGWMTASDAHADMLLKRWSKTPTNDT